MTRHARHQLKLDRMNKAWRLTTGGKTQREIAAELGVSQAAVQKLVKEAEHETLAAVQDTVLAQKIRQTHRLEGLYREAMLAWEASKGEVTRRKAKQAGVGAEARSEVEIVTETSVGNPAYLAQAVAINAEIRKIWGLDAPTKLAHTVKDPNDEPDLSRLSEQELLLYRDLTAKAEGR